jgi:carbamate kinase
MVLELEAITTLLDSGVITIAGGGGGVAVRAGYDSFEGVEAVVDKDLTSSLLARAVNADLLLILTNIAVVRVNFNTPQERRLERTNVSELRQLQQARAFGEG